MRSGRGVWCAAVLGLCAACGGGTGGGSLPAGANEPAAPPEVPNASGAGDAAEGVPPSTAQTGLDAPPTLSAVGCAERPRFPWNVRHPHACVETWVDADGTLTRWVRDAAGREVEHLHGDSRTTTVQGPHGPLQRRWWSGGLVSREETWSYDARGRVIETTHTANGATWTARHVYRDDGRLDRIEHLRADGRVSIWYGYRYDGPHLVERRLWFEGAVKARWTYAHDEAGTLRSESYLDDDWPTYAYEKTYDADGQLVLELHRGDEGGSRRELEWAAGRLARVETRSQGGLGSSREVLETYSYDGAGRRSVWRIAEDEQTYRGEVTGTLRHSWRAQYACGTEDVLREEVDVDEDGAVDGAYVYRRDPAGNLLEVMAEGAARELEEPVRRTFEYGCFGAR